MSFVGKYPPFEGEGAVGYLARLTEIGGWTCSASAGNDVFGFRRRHRNQTGGLIPAMKALLGDGSGPVEYNSPIEHDEREDPPLLYRGQFLFENQFIPMPREVLRFCPACVADDLSGAPRGRVKTWRRSWWGLRQVDICHLHGIEILDRCDCGSPVDPYRPLSGHCRRCDAFLGDCVRRERPASQVAGQRYVLGRIGLGPRVAAPLLDPLTLGEAARACTALGRELAKIGRAGTELDVGFDALRCWPDGYQLALEEIAGSRKDRTGDGSKRWGALEMFGTLYQWVAQHKHTEPARAMAAEMAAFVDRAGFSPGRTVLGVRCGGGRTVDLASLSRATGISYARIRRIVEARGALVVGGSGRPAAIDADAAAELERELAGSVTLSTVCDCLGIDTQTGRKLGSSILKPVVEGGIGGTHHAFPPDAAENLFLSIVAALRAGTQSLTRLPDACRDRGVSIADAVQQILQGTVRGSLINCWTRKGIQNVWVVASDLRKDRDFEILTVNDLAKQLEVKWQDARTLVDRDIVGSWGKEIITPRSIRDFRAVYVSAACIAREERTSSNALIARLRGHGVEPAFGPPEFRKVFYRRKEVEELAELPAP